MLVGEIDAAHHLVALPDHPHLLRRLDEIEWLRRIKQLPWDAAGVAPRLGGERHLSLAAERLVIRRLHLRGGPGLEHRVLVVAEPDGHLPRAVEIAVIWLVGDGLNRAAHAGRR